MLACSETSRSLPRTWGLKLLGRAWIMSDNFWLSDRQWAAIAPLLPMVHTGPVRQDDRRIISGILHRLREGCRWRALPAEYGPYTTVFNRHNRWSQRGLWQDIFAALANGAEPPVVAILRWNCDPDPNGKSTFGLANSLLRRHH